MTTEITFIDLVNAQKREDALRVTPRQRVDLIDLRDAPILPPDPDQLRLEAARWLRDLAGSDSTQF